MAESIEYIIDSDCIAVINPSGFSGSTICVLSASGEVIWSKKYPQLRVAAYLPMENVLLTCHKEDLAFRVMLCQVKFEVISCATGRVLQNLALGPDTWSPLVLPQKAYLRGNKLILTSLTGKVVFCSVSSDSISRMKILVISVN